MPALVPTNVTGRVTWIGRVPDRDATLRSEPLRSVDVTFEGIPGEDHAGLTRASCSRVLSQHPRGTVIRNVRQFTVLSTEELADIAGRMKLDAIDPAWVGASLIVEGIPDFTHVPPSSRLQFASGLTLVVDMENHPCHLPADVIDEERPGHGSAFRSAARRRRGVSAWVEREGRLTVGDAVALHIPDQRAWAHLDSVTRGR